MLPNPRWPGRWPTARWYSAGPRAARLAWGCGSAGRGQAVEASTETPLSTYVYFVWGTTNEIYYTRLMSGVWMALPAHG
jgi:hypothetical protein